jgi:hypothetical protein
MGIRDTSHISDLWGSWRKLGGAGFQNFEMGKRRDGLLIFFLAVRMNLSNLNLIRKNLFDAEL